MKMLFIYCSGGVGREVCDIADRLNSDADVWNEICFIDDTKESSSIYGKRSFVYTRFKEEFSPDECEVSVANGEPEVRRILSEKLLADGYTLANVIDKTAVVSPTAQIGRGIVIYPYAFVSSNALIGENVLIYNHATVAHDCIVGDNTVLSIGAKIAGSCKLERCCFIGANAAVKEKIGVKAYSVVGMCAMVCKDTSEYGVYAGVPAEKIRENKNLRIFR